MEQVPTSVKALFWSHIPMHTFTDEFQKHDLMFDTYTQPMKVSASLTHPTVWASTPLLPKALHTTISYDYDIQKFQIDFLPYWYCLLSGSSHFADQCRCLHGFNAFQSFFGVWVQVLIRYHHNLMTLCKYDKNKHPPTRIDQNKNKAVIETKIYYYIDPIDNNNQINDSQEPFEILLSILLVTSSFLAQWIAFERWSRSSSLLSWSAKKKTKRAPLSLQTHYPLPSSPNHQKK